MCFVGLEGDHGLYCGGIVTRAVAEDESVKHGWRFWLALCALSAALLLAGCGQKGPLFIPDKAAQAQNE